METRAESEFPSGKGGGGAGSEVGPQGIEGVVLEHVEPNQDPSRGPKVGKTNADKTDTTPITGDGYQLVTDPTGLGLVCAAVEESGFVGVDCETTGLNPRADRLRLLTLNCDTHDGGPFTYPAALFQVDPRPLGG